MKVKYIWVVLIALTFFGCDDTTDTLGLDMFPESDQNIKGNSTEFDVTTESMLSGAVFAKTSVGYLGKFTDPKFGFFESGFMAQLNCVDNITFPSVYDAKTNREGIMVRDSIDYAELIFTYSSYFGDSLNACRMSVYQLDKVLERDPQTYYTNINPNDYYVTDSLLGHKAYTAVDLSLSDSIRNQSDFVPYVRLTLDKKLGERIFRLNRTHPEYFKNSDEFIKNVFKGIYVKSDYGDGTVLYIDQIQLTIAYKCYVKDDNNDILKMHDGVTDSTYYSRRVFASTKEVIQTNQFKNSELIEQRAKEPNHTYLKTPAGIYTKATLPINEIAEKLSNDTINAVKLTFTHYNQQSDYKFGMTAPQNVLLVRAKEMEKGENNFFEQNKLTDNKTSYYATVNTANNQYTFKNLTRLINTCISEKADAKKKAGNSWNEAQWEAENPDWNKVIIVPVTITYDSNKKMIGINHDLKPGYAMLKGGDPNQGGSKLKMEVIYTSFNK